MKMLWDQLGLVEPLPISECKNYAFSITRKPLKYHQHTLTKWNGGMQT